MIINGKQFAIQTNKMFIAILFAVTKSKRSIIEIFSKPIISSIYAWTKILRKYKYCCI